jgi:hypothetical protein
VLQVLLLVGTVARLVGTAVHVARTALTVLAKVRVVPRAQYVRDADMRVNWFMHGAMDVELGLLS